MFNRYFDSSGNSIDFIFANISVKNIYFALISLDYILSRPNIDYDIYYDDHTYYFFHLQSLLTACGNISNVFYNPGGFNGKQVTARCQRLRQQFNINKADFPLVFLKEVRNTNEHFDERYEQYHGRVGDYNIIDQNTDPAIRTIIQCNPHLRTYDKEHGIYITYNRKLQQISYDLFQLQNELEEMRVRIINNPMYESAWVDSMPGEELK